MAPADTPAPGNLATPTEIAENVAGRWGWFVFLGLVMVILGTIGLGMVGFLSVVSVIYIAIMLLIGGGVQLVHAFQTKGWRSSLADMAGAVLYLVAGVLLLAHPVIGLVTVTLFLGAAILAAGVVRLVIAYQHRAEEGWVWLALSGGVGVALGILLLVGWPANAEWVVGLFVAIDMLMSGWTMLFMGLAMRRWKDGEAPSPAP